MALEGRAASNASRPMACSSRTRPRRSSSPPNLAAFAVIRPERPDLVPLRVVVRPAQDGGAVTLDLQSAPPRDGFTLRDATAYNVQFHRGRPVLIDTLSFERAVPGAPVGRLSPVLRALPGAARADGPTRHPPRLAASRPPRRRPLDLAAALLPGRTRLSLGLGRHVHRMPRAQRVTPARRGGRPRRAEGDRQPDPQAALLDSLRPTIGGLAGSRRAPSGPTTPRTLVRRRRRRGKDALVDAAAARPPADGRLGPRRQRGPLAGSPRGPPSGSSPWTSTRPRANDTGAVLATARNSDPAAAPDLAEPEPGRSAGRTRASFRAGRGATLLALALIHHLAIRRNLPLADALATLTRLGESMVIEFVPKGDDGSTAAGGREDIFPDYTLEGFERGSSTHWTIATRRPVEGTARVLYRLVQIQREGEPAPAPRVSAASGNLADIPCCLLTVRRASRSTL